MIKNFGRGINLLFRLSGLANKTVLTTISSLTLKLRLVRLESKGRKDFFGHSLKGCGWKKRFDHYAKSHFRHIFFKSCQIC